MDKVEKLLTEQFHLAREPDPDNPAIVGFRKTSPDGYSISILYTAGVNEELDILVVPPNAKDARQEWIPVEPFNTLAVRLDRTIPGACGHKPAS